MVERLCVRPRSHFNVLGVISGSGWIARRIARSSRLVIQIGRPGRGTDPWFLRGGADFIVLRTVLPGGFSWCAIEVAVDPSRKRPTVCPVLAGVSSYLQILLSDMGPKGVRGIVADYR